MEKRYFFCSSIADDKIVINDEESRHISKVLRGSPGDTLSVLDGKGNEYHCEILSIGRNVEVIVLDKTFHANTNNLRLGIAPTKKTEKMEWLIEKLTELGLHSITFLKTDHSEKHRLKLERLEKKALAALKQSGQFWLPKIHLDVEFNNWIQSAAKQNTWIAHCMDNKSRQSFEFEKDKPVFVAIGPEGDFSPNEVDFALEKGFKGLHLGESRLRTETAGLTVGVLANLR